MSVEGARAPPNKPYQLMKLVTITGLNKKKRAGCSTQFSVQVSGHRQLICSNSLVPYLLFELLRCWNWTQACNFSYIGCTPHSPDGQWILMHVNAWIPFLLRNKRIPPRFHALLLWLASFKGVLYYTQMLFFNRFGVRYGVYLTWKLGRLHKKKH